MRRTGVRQILGEDDAHVEGLQVDLAHVDFAAAAALVGPLHLHG